MSTRSSGAPALLCAAVLALSTAAFAQLPMPVYPGVVHTQIGNDLSIDGMPHRMAYFVTKDDMVKVGRYFHDLWDGEGYPTFMDGDFVEEGVVSAFMTKEGLQRSVVLRRHGDGVVGFTVLRDYWIKQEAPRRNAASDFPKLEGAIFTGDLGLDDGDGTARQRTQIVPGDLMKVRGEILKRMELKALKLTRESGQKFNGQDQLVLEHNAPGTQVVTVLSPVEGTYVAVHQTWIASDRVDAVPNDKALEKLRTQIKKEQGK